MTTLTKIIWSAPDPDSTYNNTFIYSSTSKYGTYSLLTTITDIRTTQYIDLTGTPTTWYKIRFADMVNGVYSDYSPPMPANGIIGDLNYTVPRRVATHLNNFRRITSEAVGTGDGTTVKFGPLAEQFPIEDTETVYIAAVEKTRNSEYTVDYETGYITFTTAPADSAAITADYWTNSYCSNERVVDAIRRAESEINHKLRRTFYQPQQVTEYVDSFDPLDTKPYSYEARDFVDMTSDYRPKMNEALYSRLIKLDNYPITSFLQVIINAQPTDADDEAVGTGDGVVTDYTLDNTPIVYGSEEIYVAGIQVSNYTINYSTGAIAFTGTPPTGAITADYTYCTGGTILTAAQYLVREDSGLVYLKDTSAQVKQNPLICAVTYKYGYETIPALIERLATLTAMADVMTSTIMGAPQAQDVSRSNIDAIRREIEFLYDSLGRVMDVTRI